MNVKEEFYRLADKYRRENCPALSSQFEKWYSTRPLDGVRVFDATPVFMNTVLKHLCLIAAGAELTVAYDDKMPYDLKAIRYLENLGVRTSYCYDELKNTYDVVCDCGGRYSDMTPGIGFVELTRTGVHRYEGKKGWPVISVDSSSIKELETILGTGDGCIRALEKLCLRVPEGAEATVFGAGKVGKGIAYSLHRRGFHVNLIDDWTKLKPLPFCNCVWRDTEGAIACLKKSVLAVTATGVKDALSNPRVLNELCSHVPYIANMGVEDEFGDGLSEDIVLNRKRPLNFILDEPTQIQYVEPTMALDNQSVLDLVEDNYIRGTFENPDAVSSPSYSSEDDVIHSLRDGSVAREIKDNWDDLHLLLDERLMDEIMETSE